MGPINLDKIKQAHHKLMRLDPEYSQLQKRKIGTVASKVQDEFDAAFKELTERNELFASGGGRVHWTPQLRDRVLAECVTPAKETVGKPLKRERSGGRTAKSYKFKGESLTIKQWAAQTGLKEETIRNRLLLGWSVADAVTRSDSRQVAKGKTCWSPGFVQQTYSYNGKDLTLKELSKLSGITRHSIETRIRRGWTVEAAVTIAPGAPRPRTSPAGGWVRTSDDHGGTAPSPKLDTEQKQGFLQ